jgi:hypothetical protein
VKRTQPNWKLAAATLRKIRLGLAKLQATLTSIERREQRRKL